MFVCLFVCFQGQPSGGGAASAQSPGGPACLHHAPADLRARGDVAAGRAPRVARELGDHHRGRERHVQRQPQPQPQPGPWRRRRSTRSIRRRTQSQWTLLSIAPLAHRGPVLQRGAEPTPDQLCHHAHRPQTHLTHRESPDITLILYTHTH